MTLFEFASEKSIANWYDQNDTVMGGVSSSRMDYAGAGIAVFRGEVSLDNNGGFAQVRYDKTSFDLSDYSGLELRVQGQGKRYQLRLSTDAARINYAQSFTASTDWVTVQLPFDAFEPGFRGRKVVGAPALNTADIRALGLMISDKQVGPFALQLDYIKAY